MLHFADVRIGTGGITVCQRCGGHRPGVPRAVEAIAAEFASLAGLEHRGPGPNVVFTGMEPFAHPSLPRLIAAAVESGFERIRLRTDAGALQSAENAHGVVAAGVRHIEVAILGPPDHHDELAGRSGAYAAAAAGLSSFVQAAEQAHEPVFVGAYLPLCPHNAETAPAAVAALEAMGATAVLIDASRLQPDSRHHGLLFSAMETATINRLMVSVAGWTGEALPGIYGSHPWTVTEPTVDGGTP